MQDLLVGRWRAYKMEHKGTPTSTDGLAFKINSNGLVEYARKYQGKWFIENVHYAIKEENGKTFITEEGEIRYEIENVSQYEMRLSILERYNPKPILVYFLKRVVG